ncbi:MAG TPA: FeoA family protein [Candidatus Sabulitectum sp.]|nr:FeoA family protein [Candidatus Sabulitectum sp.]HRW78463.1 FeoA family protein [Candidatus Sabulitectum sp.]
MFGFCRRGRKCASACLSLADIPQGGTARITAFSGGRGIRERMTSMGLFPGTVVTVVHTHGENGMILVSAGSSRFMVDPCMAARVQVERTA